MLPTPISKFRLGVSQVSKTRSLAFCPTCLERSAGTVEVDWVQMVQGFVQKKVLLSIDLIGSFVPFDFLYL